MNGPIHRYTTGVGQGACVPRRPAHPTPPRTSHPERTLRRRRRAQPPRRDPNEPRINDEIRVPRVLLIDDDGTKLGQFLTTDALDMAQHKGLDLIEVAAQARPPVCRIGDYGKMKYERKKREKEAKARQHQTQVKELKVRPKTDDHDMNVRIRRARKFLKQGNKVKVTVRFRGREHAHHDIGRDQCLRLADSVSRFGRIETRPRMDGRQMHMLLAPRKDAVAQAG